MSGDHLPGPRMEVTIAKFAFRDIWVDGSCDRLAVEHTGEVVRSIFRWGDIPVKRLVDHDVSMLSGKPKNRGSCVGTTRGMDDKKTLIRQALIGQLVTGVEVTAECIVLLFHVLPINRADSLCGVAKTVGLNVCVIHE